jgi:hypothetical protein
LHTRFSKFLRDLDLYFTDCDLDFDLRVLLLLPRLERDLDLDFGFRVLEPRLFTPPYDFLAAFRIFSREKRKVFPCSFALSKRAIKTA